MKNNTNTNLLTSIDFISALRFEVDYANTIKGGYLPGNLTEIKRKRLVSDVNLISYSESVNLISNLFIGKN